MADSPAQAEFLRAGEEKKALRERMWTLLEDQKVVPIPPGAHDRIPNFLGRERAAERLADAGAWKAAAAIKANPDKAQLPVRLAALREGKRLYMAVPRLRAAHPFVLLDPKRLRGPLEQAVTSEGGVRAGLPVTIDQMERIDLVVSGSVAVNRHGSRLGKGGGFADLEFALLVEAGRITAETPIATTVHDIQLLDEDIPETRHDFRVDIVATPSETIEVPGPHGRHGIVWEHLDQEKIRSIPVLAARRAEPRRGGDEPHTIGPDRS